ncbi:MAG TPA: DoxX family protein [Gemmatimonadales bacterium]|jgi:putative oxidoreductase|nr:DoxX family protein [Gemmatimonadales bacterium]
MSLPAITAWGLFPLRIVVGTVFLMHGGQKLFVFGLAGTTAAMTQMGIPLPAVSAVLVMAVELLGGAAILAGMGTRWAALLLTGDMAVAILAVRLPGGFFAPRGFEFEFTLLGALLTLALLGPGRGPLDGLLRRFSGG